MVYHLQNVQHLNNYYYSTGTGELRQERNQGWEFPLPCAGQTLLGSAEPGAGVRETSFQTPEEIHFSWLISSRGNQLGAHLPLLSLPPQPTCFLGLLGTGWGGGGHTQPSFFAT